MKVFWYRGRHENVLFAARMVGLLGRKDACDMYLALFSCSMSPKARDIYLTNTLFHGVLANSVGPT